MKDQIYLYYKKALRHAMYVNHINNLNEIQSRLLTKSGFVNLRDGLYVHQLFPKMIFLSSISLYTDKIILDHKMTTTVQIDFKNEEEFFQYSTVENTFDLTFDDILEFREKHDEIVRYGRKYIDDMLTKVHASTIFPKQTEDRLKAILEHYSKL